MFFSSNDTFVLAKDFRIASSNGLMVCILITSAEIPFASSASAATLTSQTNNDCFDCYVGSFVGLLLSGYKWFVSWREVGTTGRQVAGVMISKLVAL
jgi:hypothetical protein